MLAHINVTVIVEHNGEVPHIELATWAKICRKCISQEKVIAIGNGIERDAIEFYITAGIVPYNEDISRVGNTAARPDLFHRRCICTELFLRNSRIKVGIHLKGYR